jgi:hypothetical protein
MPEQFTAGKNLFKFKPITSRFSTSDPIQIEVIDFNGNQIYHEVLNYKEDDGSLVVAIYVYEDTSDGNCTITLVGTTVVDENFKPLPPNERTSNNIKYQYSLYVNTMKQNDSEIIFINEPVVSVSERRFSVVEEKFSVTKIGTVEATGSYIFNSDTPKLLSAGTPFQKFFENGTIRFNPLSSTYTPSVGFPTGSFEYVSDITSVRTPFQMELKTPVKVVGTLDQSQILKTISNQPYEVTFSYTPSTRLVTQNVKTYAQLDISNLQPAVGDVTRVKVFYKTTFKPESDYEQIYDSEISPKNILVDVSSSMVEYPIGIFEGQEAFIEPLHPIVPDIVDAMAYWSASTTDVYATASISTYDAPLFGSLIAIADRELSGSSEIVVSQTSSINIPFYKDSEYRVVFDYYTTTAVSESRGPKIDVYITGSSFVNDSQFGKYVGSVPSGSQAKTFDLDYSLKIPTNTDGVGRLVFVLRRGSIVSNIRIIEDVDHGFTPNRIRLYVPIKSDHRSEYLDFKVQFFNNSLLGANKEVEVYDKIFTGGNTYIYGSDNLITGSTFISPFTSSGIQAYGDKTTTSSGSAIKSYGYQGIEEATASLNPITASKFGWAVTTHDPFHNNTTVGKSVEMINECGSLIEFRSSPPSLKFYAVGANTSFLVGESGSSEQIGGGSSAADCANGTCGDSYIKWDGCRIIIKGAIDGDGNPIGGTSGGNGQPGSAGSAGSSGTSGAGSSGTSGTDGSGTGGTSGVDGSSGTSGINGSSGTSGANGTAGTSGQNGSSGTSGQNGSSGTSGNSGSAGTSGNSGSAGTSGQTPTPLDCCACVELMIESAEWVAAGSPPNVPTGQFRLLHDCGVVTWIP